MLRRSIAVAASTVLMAGAAVASDFTDTKSMKDAISGSMNITFNTRTETDQSGASYFGAPKTGVRDVYGANLSVMNSVVITGNIERQPWLPTGTLGTTLQDGFISYGLKLGIKNPKDPSQVKMVGDWIGAMRMDGDGKYHLADAPDQYGTMRIATQTIGNIPGFVSKFQGSIQGRMPEQAGLWGGATRASKQISKKYQRWSQGKLITREVKGADPMRFDAVDLAQGPVAGYPQTRLNGSIDYDGEQGIWYVDVTTSYTADGNAMKDRYSGTMRWVDGPNRQKDGAGWYEMNVQINEKPAPEAALFTDQESSSEDAFFAADNQVPGFLGKINYVDSFDDDTVTGSKIAFAVESVQASKIQTMNFAKILMLMIGPFNDE